MRLFRRHRGSQSEGAGIVISISDHPDRDPYAVARDLTFAMSRQTPPKPLTARQSLTASLSRDQDLANEPDRLFSLVDDILLDLETNRLSIVASTEVEDAPEVLGRARQDRPPGW